MTHTFRGPRRALSAALVVGMAGATVLTLASCGVLGGGDDSEGRSVIFVNGDGMAAVHREAARLDQVGFDGELAMDSLAVSGTQSTDSADPSSTVTDSAAAASAWATGEKTYNGAVSVDLEGNPLAVLGAEAKQSGRATGLVTTAQVTDATPAAFFSATADRGDQDDIARQYVEVTKPDVVLGGGEDWWLPAGSPGAYRDSPAGDSEEGSRGTKGNLVARAEESGYEYVTDADQLAEADGDRLLGLFANQEMFQQEPENEGDEFAPVVPLATMTEKALDVLSRDEDGFFLLVEEEAVDEMSHQNNGARMLESMRSLEAAVKVARDFVREHPDTLLIVTGDHESGGLTIEEVGSDDESGPGGTLGRGTTGEGDTTSGEDGPFRIADSDKTFALDWTTGSHSAVTTPVTAEGPGSERLSGHYPNTHLHEVVGDIVVD
jgi:alkaline phosphatase